MNIAGTLKMLRTNIKVDICLRTEGGVEKVNIKKFGEIYRKIKLLGVQRKKKWDGRDTWQKWREIVPINSIY